MLPVEPELVERYTEVPQLKRFGALPGAEANASDMLSVEADLDREREQILKAADSRHGQPAWGDPRCVLRSTVAL